MQKVVPFLWFDNQAEEAAKLYTSLIKNSNITSNNLMMVSFTIDGQEFLALNGGPQFKFSQAFSLFVNCENQEEVDYLWENLSIGGEKGQCGWLKDRFGLSWQIVPTELKKLMSDKDPKKVDRVMQAMLKMNKIDIKLLQEAYLG